jgi:hypothetical protein
LALQDAAKSVITASMARKHVIQTDDADSLDLGPGLYDADPAAEDDLWFLDAEAVDDVGFAPLPRSDQRKLFDPNDWLAAQAEHSGALAEVAQLFGALDERLLQMGAGALAHLALKEVEEFSWGIGDRIAADRLALWMEMHLAGLQDDNQALMRGSWAFRRLTAPRLSLPATAADIVAQLGRRNAEDDAGMIAELSEAMAGASQLHPIIRGALLFHVWGVVGQGGAGTDIEAAVLGARLAASSGRGGALFLPLGRSRLRMAGPLALDKVAAWLQAAERGLLGALMQLDHLRHWQTASHAALSGLSGKTPKALVELFLALPAVNAALAEKQLGASRSSVQRNLDVMVSRGLLREITGQGRYRVWVPKL